MKMIAMALIRLYQKRISPKRRGKCPSTPSCSQYALESFERHGFRKGLRMTHERLSMCGRDEERPRRFVLLSYVALAGTLLITLFRPMPAVDDSCLDQLCGVEIDCQPCKWN